MNLMKLAFACANIIILDQFITLPVVAKEYTPVINYTVNDDHIEVMVPSGGCTTKENFEIELTGRGPTEIGFVRVEIDPCDGYMPAGQAISVSFQELDLEPGEEVIVVGSQEQVGEAIGYNLNGEETSCVVASPQTMCTMVYLEGDRFANECRAQGATPIFCGCHNYLCSEAIAFP